MTLFVTIPADDNFYSLFADGLYTKKSYVKETGETVLSFGSGAVIFLFYTYPNLRAATLVRNVPGKAALPGLSKKVNCLFTVYSSKVDKLKRATGYLNKNCGGAYQFDDEHYLRLYYVLQQRGKLKYNALQSLFQKRVD